MQGFLNCYYFQTQRSSESGFSYKWADLGVSRGNLSQFRDGALLGEIWVDETKHQTWTHVIKCSECRKTPANVKLIFTDLKKCSCCKLLVHSLVVESTVNLNSWGSEYAFLGEEVDKRMAYELGRTKSYKKTYFFFNENNRKHMFDFIGQPAAALASKAANDLTADWVPYYEKNGHLGADQLYQQLQLFKPNVCIPFVYAVVLGKHRRQDRTRYFVFENPDKRLKVAHEHAKRMFSVQSKGKSKKDFLAELLVRIESMNALWPERMPIWAPFIETCIMLEFEVGISF